METPFPLGRRPAFDEKSRRFSAFPVKRLPKHVKHRVFGARLNQEDVGACTGFALVGARNTGPNHFHGEIGLRNDVALSVYKLATELDEFDGTYPPDDTGSSGLAACKAGVQLGVISRYEWCFGLDHLLGVLVKRPVMVGANWYESMFTPDARGRVSVTGRSAGGHEWFAVGFDLPTREVHAVNSWGTGWGVKGRFLISFHDLDRLLHEDGDVKVPIR